MKRKGLSGNCSIQTHHDRKGVETVTIENGVISLTLLPEKGGDIYSLVYNAKNIDVLWKSPWGTRLPGKGISPSFNSEALWLEYYPGGWQELFPNGGDPCFYKGVELNFHGEASVVPWDYRIISNNPEEAILQLETRLFRSPFTMEKTFTLRKGDPFFSISERITNEAAESMDYMWGHHPALGAPFLSGNCFIDCGAEKLIADDMYAGENNPLTPGGEYSWPFVPAVNGTEDFSKVPDTERALLGYLGDFDKGWYAVTNPDIGLSFALKWPKEIMPYAWFWQELKASSGFPFYKNCYVMAIEPNTSIPGQGLRAVMEKTKSHGIVEPRGHMDFFMDVFLFENEVSVSADMLENLLEGES